MSSGAGETIRWRGYFLALCGNGFTAAEATGGAHEAFIRLNFFEKMLKKRLLRLYFDLFHAILIRYAY